MANSLRVLIVDDSRVFRGMVEEALRDQTDVEVVGSVYNGVKAVEFIQKHEVDVLTLDVEMPEMDGLQVLRQINRLQREGKLKHPPGAVMLSALTKKGADATIAALSLGAFDFIEKPDSELSASDTVVILRRQLLVKLRFYASRLLAGQRTFGSEAVEIPRREPTAAALSKGVQAILIGVSTGGPRALSALMPDLCQRTELPILIVQHMPATFTASLAHSLDQICRHKVVEGTQDMRVEAGHAYVAPGGHHMVLRKAGNGARLEITDTPPVKGCRPSVDELFLSGASVYGAKCLAMILTGMGNDGTDGAERLKAEGVWVMVQDEASSVVWGMPGSAVKRGCVDQVLSLADLPRGVELVLQRAGRK